MKKICFLMVLLLLLSCFSGCGQAKKVNPGYPTEIPAYNDDKQLDVVAFWSPPVNDEHYTWMKECGITAVVVDNKYGAESGTVKKKILSMCDELGIDVYFTLNRFQNGEAIREYEQWLTYASFAGFYCDEPVSKTHIDNVADQAKEAYALSPRLRVILNMLPEYSPYGVGYDWIYSEFGGYQEAVDNGEFFASYEAYVAYVQEKLLIPYDNAVVTATNYPLADYELHEITLDNSWLDTLGRSKQSTQNSGREMWQYIATTAYHSGGLDYYHRQPTEADIRWMTYAALAYGATGIMEFVYTTVGAGAEFDEDDHGAIWWTDQNDLSGYYRTDVWYSAQKVHQELFKFDHVLLSFDWTGVLCHNVTDDPSVTPVFENAVGKLENHKRIEKIEGTGDLLIGCFEDQNQYDGFLVVNFTETAHNSHLRNTVSITFDYATKALVYVRGEQQFVELENHTYTCTLFPGEAVFMIPVA